jgi:hypothetical protein
MSKLFGNYDIMSNGPKLVLNLAGLGLFIASYMVNKKSLENLESNNMSEMKNQVTQLKNIVWALYAVYLLQFFLNVYNPTYGMITSATSISVIGVVLTTVLVLCIIHVSNICTEASCDIMTAKSSLERVNILLAVLVAVHIGSAIAVYNSPTVEAGFTAKILELLRTPSRGARSFRRRSPSSNLLNFGDEPILHGEL